MTYPQRIGLLLISVAFSFVGCDREENAIRSYSAPKDVVSSAPVVADAEVPAAPQDTASAASAALRWTLPAGWKQVGGSSEMRYATIQVTPDAPETQLTITPLGPEAGALLPNVQRWAGQLGVKAVSDADLSKYATQTQISGEQAHVVDIAGSEESGKPAMRLLAAIIPHDGKTWFVKLTAPGAIAAAQKMNFESFLHSLQFSTDRGNAAPSSPSLADAPAALKAAPEGSFRLAGWKTPDGWTEQPGANSMRITSFRIGTGAESAEVIVTRIGQGQTGSFLDNINRWRGQVGLEPVTEQKPGEMKTINVAGHQALLLSFTGPKSASGAVRQLEVSMDLEGGDFWFVKMLGPQSVVSVQQDAFKQFLASLQFLPESH